MQSIIERASGNVLYVFTVTGLSPSWYSITSRSGYVVVLLFMLTSFLRCLCVSACVLSKLEEYCNCVIQ